MNEWIRAFILLFAVIDPIGTLPVFLGISGGYDKATQRKIAGLATLIAAGILLFFIVVGQVLIEHMNISLPAFQVSGGLVLLIFALSMVFGKGHGDDTQKEAADYKHVAVFPMAIPALASPGAILAVVLLTDNNVYSIGQQIITTLITFTILLITYLLLLAAGRIQKAIGNTGITVITKIMGILLCSLAIESMLAGIKSYFSW
jgi:multiple antibiotic resistance protein